MKEKIKLTQAVLVEGRYDKNKLDSILDALIIPVHGFSVFTNLELRQLIRKLAAQQGIVVLMDSDAAGFKIRGFIRGIVPKEQLTDVYIPDVLGKEKRKKEASKEGKLGVEGIDVDTLRRVFSEAGLTNQNAETESAIQTKPITKQDFIALGLSGGSNSSLIRGRLFKELNLPERLTANAAIPLLNSMLTRDEFFGLVESMKE